MCSRRLTSRNRASDVCGTLPGTFEDLCVACYEGDSDDVDQDVVDAFSRPSRSHLGHGHPLTPSARARCRKENANNPLRDDADVWYDLIMTTNTNHDLDTFARGIIVSNNLGDVTMAIAIMKEATAQGFTASQVAHRADELK